MGTFSESELQKIEEIYAWSSAFKKAEHDAEGRLYELLKVDEIRTYEQAAEIERVMLLCVGTVGSFLGMYDGGYEVAGMERVDKLLAQVQELVKRKAVEDVIHKATEEVEKRFEALGVVEMPSKPESWKPKPAL